MRGSSLLWFTAVLAAATGSPMGSVQHPLLTPQFESLFAGQLTIASILNTTGPFGIRIHGVVSG